SVTSARRTSCRLRPFQGDRERRLTLTADPQGGQLARLYLEPELQLYCRPRGLSRFEFADYQRADLADRVQRAAHVHITQHSTPDLPIHSASTANPTPSRTPAGDPRVHRLSPPSRPVHYPPPRPRRLTAASKA